MNFTTPQILIIAFGVTILSAICAEFGLTAIAVGFGVIAFFTYMASLFSYLDRK